MSTPTTYTFTAGILLCGKVRELLEGLEFMGHDIDWREGKGWLEREWIVRGDPETIKIVSHQIDKWKFAK